MWLLARFLGLLFKSRVPCSALCLAYNFWAKSYVLLTIFLKRHVYINIPVDWKLASIAYPQSKLNLRI